MSRNCPNCGAPIEGAKCQYCGTLLLDFADIDIDKPTYVRIKLHNQVVMVKARVDNISFTEEGDDCCFYADSKPYYIARPAVQHISMDMTVLADAEGILARTKKVSGSITSK